MEAGESAAVPVLCEGAARIPYSGDSGVFYNKVQVFNRDLSILVISAFVKRREREHRDGPPKRQRKAASARNAEADATPAAAASDPPAASQRSSEHDGSAEEEATRRVCAGLTEEAETAEERAEAEEEKAGQAASGTAAPSAESPPRPPFPGLSVLEALSATGLRSIRYFLEIPSVSRITVNDSSAAAVAAIRSNIAFNGLDNGRVLASQCDAKALMYSALAPSAARFDVIDLDPYGSACEFFDSAVQAVSAGGLLCITCTDKAVLCGAWGEVAYVKYGGYALKGRNCHEMAVRLVLGALQSAAARYRRLIVPLLSLSIDFYVRVFVRVVESQLQVKQTASRMLIAYQCTGCEAVYSQRMGRATAVERSGSGSGSGGSSVTYRHTASIGPPCPQLCPDCRSPFKLGGPMWAEALHDPEFVSETLAYAASVRERFSTYERVLAMLTVARKELSAPFYWSLSSLCHVLHCQQPKIWLVRAAIIHAGYECSDTHALPDGIKTTAPPSAVWDIMRSYIQQNPHAKGRHRQRSSSSTQTEQPRCCSAYSPAALLCCSSRRSDARQPCGDHPQQRGAVSIATADRRRPAQLRSLTSCLATAAACACQAHCGLQLRRRLRLEQTEHRQSEAASCRCPAATSSCAATDAALLRCCCLLLRAAAAAVPKFLPNPEDFWGPKQRATQSKRKPADDEAAGGGDDALPAQQKRARLLQGRNRRKRVCEKMQQTGSCRFGDRCKFSHDLHPAAAASVEGREEHKDDKEEKSETDIAPAAVS